MACICKHCVYGGCCFCTVDAASCLIDQALSFLLLPLKSPSKTLKRSNIFWSTVGCIQWLSHKPIHLHSAYPPAKGTALPSSPDPFCCCACIYFPLNLRERTYLIKEQFCCIRPLVWIAQHPVSNFSQQHTSRVEWKIGQVCMILMVRSFLSQSCCLCIQCNLTKDKKYSGDMWFTCLIPGFEWFFVDTWMQLLMILKDLSQSPKENYLYSHGWSKGVGCPCAKWVEGLSVKKLCHSCGWLWVTLTFQCHGRGMTGSSQRNSVFLQRCFLTAAQPVLCVLPINKQVGQQHSSSGALAHRLCRHLTSASLLRLYLVSASWGPMEHFWSSPDCYCALVWGDAAPTLKAGAPFTAELAIDMQQLFSPTSSRRVWQTLNPWDRKKDSSKMFGLL